MTTPIDEDAWTMACLFVLVRNKLLMQRRAPRKPGQTKGNSYGYVLQPAVHGKREDHRTPYGLILDEMSQGEGGAFLSAMPSLQIVTLPVLPSSPKLVAMLVQASWRQAGRYTYHPEEAAGIEWITREDFPLIRVAEKSDEAGVREDEYVMWPDHLALTGHIFNTIVGR